MSLNQTPAGERVHIGFFGLRNAGKSSLVNAVAGQSLSVVSDVCGTTTDPVRKAMELLPLGPVLLIDTPGFDDEGALGTQRVQKTREVLNETDVAVLVTEAGRAFAPAEEELLRLFRERETPFLIARNKSDLLPKDENRAGDQPPQNETYVSALTGLHIAELKAAIARLAPEDPIKLRLVADLIAPGDFVVLVTPIDKSAPKGRLILPQQQAIRDILEADATAITVKEFELADTLRALGRKPALVITDSQVFAKAAADVPPDIPLTSFSILFARYKGYLSAAAAGVRALETLPGDSHILIAEGCTHHRQCDDIGTVKIPRWIRSETGKRFHSSSCSGWEFPADLTGVDLVIHCGGCMLNERAVRARLRAAQTQGVPFTNYGVVIAWAQGILERCLLNGRLGV
ncbi:MAG: [FeFe] hydrogenase H-cluster maturation GTPase HydF [Oscillospiraceae bacterium]|jgi:[FeFe] hydrogenase H-cluster maturation GTPase HydF|nr:[FeFe] hydrogenase H-cluster maturation GTPase HydF [Oscillospiraceae bacterium]